MVLDESGSSFLLPVQTNMLQIMFLVQSVASGTGEVEVAVLESR